MLDRNFLSEFIREEIYLLDQAVDATEVNATTDQILVVTPADLSDMDTKFLHKIFKAVNIAAKQLELSQEDSSSGAYQAIFYFGKEPADWSGSYYEKSLQHGPPMIVGHSLSEIAADNTKKRELWSILQALF